MAKTRVKGFLALSVVYLILCLFYSNCAMREEGFVPSTIGTLNRH